MGILASLVYMGILVRLVYFSTYIIKCVRYVMYVLQGSSFSPSFLMQTA
jgi:hypothetical protein